MTTATHVKRSVLIAVGIALAALGGFIRFTSTNGTDYLGANDPRASTGATNLVVTIGVRTFSMTDGLGTAQAVSGSATPDTIRVVGEPARGDVDRDGHPDAALFIENDLGGGDDFYYAVLAVDQSGTYHATNALLLGNGIEPLTVDFLDGRFVYNYSERRLGEPITASPSVQRSLWIRFDRAEGVISAGS